MDTERENLQAVHQYDLLATLDKKGLKADFVQGKLFCKFCKTTMTIENIHSILPESGTTNFICNKPECISQLTEYLAEKRNSKPQ